MVTECRFQMLPNGRLGREDVLGTAWRLKPHPSILPRDGGTVWSGGIQSAVDWRRGLGLLVVIAVSTLLPVSGWAQPSLLPNLKASTASNGFEQPEQALEALLTGVEKQDFDLARRALDLSGLNFAIRDVEGLRRAEMAVAVLNRAQGFKVTGSVTRSDRLSIPLRLADGRQVVGRIELAKDPKFGWQITSESVNALPELWAKMRDAVPVNGFPTDFEAGLDQAQQLRSRINRHLWREVLWIEIWQWIALGLLGAGASIVGRILRAIISKPLRKRLGEGGAAALDRFKRGLGLAFGGGVWITAIPYLDLPMPVSVPIALLAKLTLAFGGILGGIGLVDIAILWAGNRAKRVVKRADSLYLPVLRNFARFLVIAVVAWVFLVSLDVNVTGIVAGLGIGGLVIALAAKDSVENLFGSLTILFDMPFGIGDWVKIGNDVNGVVEEINLRSTRIRTFDDSVITVPNSNLTKAAVENFGARRQRRINFTLALSRAEPGSALAFAEQLRAWMRENPKIRPDNAYAFVTGISDAGVSVLVQGYILTMDYEEELTVRQSLVEAITEIAERTGVEFAPLHWPALAKKT